MANILSVIRQTREDGVRRLRKQDSNRHFLRDFSRSFTTFLKSRHFKIEFSCSYLPRIGKIQPGGVEASWNIMAHAQKPDFVFRRNGRVHLNRPGASVQSTTGSRGVRISAGNAGYTMLRGSVKSTGYPLHLPLSPSLPSRASSCAIIFQLDSKGWRRNPGPSCVWSRLVWKGISNLRSGQLRMTWTAWPIRRLTKTVLTSDCTSGSRSMKVW